MPQKKPSKPFIAIAPFTGGRATRTRWVPAVAGHMRANYEKLMRHLQVLKRARSEALVNRPPQSDRDLDVTQREIVNEVEAGGNSLRQFLDSCLDTARGFISARMPERFDAEALRLESETALQRAELLQAESLTDLYARQAREAQHLTAFQREHERTQPAAYADDWGPLHALLLVVLTGETAFNCVVFAQAGGGLRSGILVAALVSMINLILGFLVIGVVGIRLIGNINPIRRWLGGIALAVGTVLALGFNYYIAVLRQELEQRGHMDFGEAFSQALSSSGIFQLDLLSVCLLMAGLAVCVIAIFKGAGGSHTYLDPYWGYRPVDKRWRDARANYDAARAACIDALKSAATTLQTRIADSLKEQFEDLKDIRTIGAEGRERAGEVADSIAEWKDMGGTLLTAYRDENSAVRGDDPPAYFGVQPDLRAMIRNLPDGEDLLQLIRDAETIYAANVDVATALNREISTLLVEKLNGFDSYLARIEAEGKRRVDDGPNVAVLVSNPIPTIQNEAA